MSWLKEKWVSILIIVLTLVGAFYLFMDKKSPPVSVEKEEMSQLEKEKIETFKQELAVTCVKPVSSISGIDLAECKDFKDNSWLYEIFFRESDFSYLPESCKRTVGELSANELVDCLEDRPERDENIFQ